MVCQALKPHAKRADGTPVPVDVHLMVQPVDALAQLFADAGADVVVSSRRVDACEEVAEQIRAKGRRALAVACHVADWGQCDALIAAAVAEFGKIDVVVGPARIDVRDRGPGVPEADRERIFEPFYRPFGHREGEGGVGLGLALVRSIATRHGGRVWADKREGGGSVFSVELP
jgi:signal transduction histidine kinase